MPLFIIKFSFVVSYPGTGQQDTYFYGRNGIEIYGKCEEFSVRKFL